MLGVARVALRRFLPAVQGSEHGRVVAIASRDRARAEEAARAFGVERAHGSYEALLADPAVDAVYVPLPNHLHVPWSVRAMEAGKHVLCEKPLALTAPEAETLRPVSERTGRRVQEAFVVRTHPRWVRAREIVRSGRLGDVRSVSATFSFFNEDPTNVRNVPATGGGALLDIGCYPVTLSRFLLGEPRRVVACSELDPRFGVDRLTSFLLDFGGAHGVFTCTTQGATGQRLEVVGSRARLVLDNPFGPPSDHETRLVVDDGRDLLGSGEEVVRFPACDQFRIEADHFADVVAGRAEPATPLADSIANARVLDALRRSASSGRWETPDS